MEMSFYYFLYSYVCYFEDKWYELILNYPPQLKGLRVFKEFLQTYRLEIGSDRSKGVL